MHTREKLTGTICKCVACAALRAERINLEALRRYTNEYRSIEDQFLEAEDLKQRAERLTLDMTEWQAELHARVRDELISEASKTC